MLYRPLLRYAVISPPTTVWFTSEHQTVCPVYPRLGVGIQMVCVCVPAKLRWGLVIRLGILSTSGGSQVPHPGSLQSVFSRIRDLMKKGGLFFRPLAPDNQRGHLLFCSGEAQLGKWGKLYLMWKALRRKTKRRLSLVDKYLHFCKADLSKTKSLMPEKAMRPYRNN